MIAADAISARAGRKTLLDRVTVTVTPGKVTALLGSNGAGKSTLIKILAGERKADGGTVRIDGHPLRNVPLRELARRRAVLPQASHLDFAFTAAEVVALGRLPWAGTDGARHDAAAIDAARQATGIWPLWTQRYTVLSGGEQQRVHLARILAQLWQPVPAAPRYLFLDEPTAALDFRHRRTILDVARRLAREGAGVLMAVHDLNLAAAYADDAVLLREGTVVASGPAETVLTEALLEDCFGVPVDILRRPGGDAVFVA
jgi:iron complex transport system ATP-binding protein